MPLAQKRTKLASRQFPESQAETKTISFTPRSQNQDNRFQRIRDVIIDFLENQLSVVGRHDELISCQKLAVNQVTKVFPLEFKKRTYTYSRT